MPNFDFRVVAPEPGLVRSKIGFAVEVEHDLSFAHEADLVIFCPMPRSQWTNVDPRLIDLARSAVERDAWVMSVCSGSFALAAAGVLDGRRATTHWMYAHTLAEMYPLIDVDPDVLFVQDGRIISSAGTAAGIDACLHLLRIELGAEMAGRIARRMVVPPHRQGGQAQYVSPVAAGSPATGTLADLTSWVISHLDRALGVPELASRASLSERQLTRRFIAETGQSPLQWLVHQRVLAAMELLEITDLPLDAVATRTGFGTASTLRRHFHRQVGTTPSAYRTTFTATR